MEKERACMVKYLLWITGIESSKWIEQLSIILKIDYDRAEELVLGAHLSTEEETRLFNVFDVNVSGDTFADLVVRDGINILRENLRFLIKNLSSSQRNSLSQRLKIHQNTITRWIKGSHRPVKSHLDALSDYLGLPTGTNLETEPIFLAYPPINILDQKVWLVERIGALGNSKLQAIFPALKLLLEEKD